MKSILFILFLMIFFICCKQRNSITPLNKMDSKTFKETAKAEISKMDTFQIYKHDSIPSLIKKAKEFNYCDSIIQIGSLGDSTERKLSDILNDKINYLRNRYFNVMRANYVILLCTYLSKEYGYETFEEPLQPNCYIRLKSDGFNKDVATEIFEEIKPQLKLFGFKWIDFYSKEKHWHQYTSGGFWDYYKYGHFEVK
jgi:hypothetical protein